jgi:glycolate oxidase iron-sulfur subunit
MDDLARCVRCGLCANACPTQVVTGLETESPRGRIAFARAIAEGQLPLTATIQSHWELCLQCRACEAVCPSGVPYGRIQERARAQLDAAPPSGRVQRRVRRFLLRNIIARPRVLKAATGPARWFARSPLRGMLRRSGVLTLSPLLANAEAQLPSNPGRRFGRLRHRTSQNDRPQAALLTGCVMRELFGDVHRATIRVLARRGVETIVPEGQGCCGALHAHDGDLTFARKLARKNIAAFERAGDGPIVVNSAGCGAAMKEYGELLAHDPEWVERAQRFSRRVVDATEYIASLDGEVAAEWQGRVAYQDPCHLAHAQRVREQPRALIDGIAGCDRVETEGADMCCGAAGIYSLVQPRMAAELRGRKADQFRAHHPDAVVTANPGCQMQYEAAVREAGIDAEVMHVIELLDRAERAAGR